VAGSMEVGQAFLKLVKPFIFGTVVKRMDLARALAIVDDVRAVKEMIDAKMADRGHEGRNVKLGTGGIREIEFLVQTIQVLAGKKVPALLDRSTLGALERFADRKLISAKERDALTAAYLFLRDVEHKLQMVHELQTHALPHETEELERCAVRMGYEGVDRVNALKRFQADHQLHTRYVNQMFRSLFYEGKNWPLLKATLQAINVLH
jgi:[glutamine synthetase] adenylyltransferase / [glutamine synthetase]-adenylyl-L-tyrosine phosphorylase